MSNYSTTSPEKALTDTDHPARSAFRRAEDTRRAGMGLSTCHISPQGDKEKLGYGEFWIGGSCVKVAKPKCGVKKRSVASVEAHRGKVKQFSYKSRLRLMRKVSQLRKDVMPIFITLTYPGAYSTEGEHWHNDLDKFTKRLLRRWPGASGIWKLEAQKRGAPHFHLMIWGVEYAYLLLFTGRAWYEVVGSMDERHLRAGTRVEAIRSKRGIFAYAAKYLGKVGREEWDNPGRFWGAFGRGNLPWAARVSVSLTYHQAARLMRYIRRAIHVRARNYQSLSGILDGEFWFDRLDQLLEVSP